ANNVTVTLSTTDLYVTITDDTEVYGDIPAGVIVSVDDGFAFDVDSYIPDGHYVLFDVFATDGTDVWESSFSVEAHAPLLSAENFIIDDGTGNNNGILDPGEIVTLTIPTANEGSANSPSAVGTLTCGNPLITIDDENYTLGIIVAGGSEDAIYTVTADSGIMIGTPITFMYEVVAGEYSFQYNFALTVGLIVEDFETNNFLSFDWQFGGNADWFITTGAYEGTYCAQSGDINDNQTSSLFLEANVLSDGEISFYKKVSSEGGWDFLRFFIDNTEMGSWSGNVSWSLETYPVTVGEHTFRWEYDKDYSLSSGNDCGWIDYIVFPAMGVGPIGTIAGHVTLTGG
ncbi:MAG: hypothetical protein KAU01_05890, partial [Candidatus Cloacimonetes bacterium]|nr:hypothetical protein [Candidatus Cloacimonadota bacterium]